MTQTKQTPVKITIRKARAVDLTGLEWEGELIHLRRIFAQAYDQYQRGEAVVWVADSPEVGIIAQAFVQLDSRRTELADGDQRAYLYGFRVRKHFRNRGIGSKMLQVIEEDLRRRGYRAVTLNVSRDNPDARRLYERQGYRIVAPEPGQWSYTNHLGERVKVNEPAWRMEKLI
jgi:ribosomal protein S18 acetylase RimI-like enzyme